MKGFNSKVVYKILSSIMFFLLSFNANSYFYYSAVGSLKGSASTSSGRSIYSLPIDLPKGIHDLTPSFSIQYKQGSGNGLLGLGVHLTGQSSITRCTKTIKTDGVTSGIEFNFNDVYCLDGERLILISGQNGRGGSEYRVGNKLTTKVIANGTSESGPESWRVYSSDSYIYDYGTTTNSIEKTSEHNLVWHISAKKDRFDNKIDYLYDVISGYYILHSVKYNDVTIKFHYRERDDRLTSYRFGEERKLTQLLQKIEIITDGGLLRSIIPTYDNVTIEGFIRYSRLKEVKVCDTKNQCMRPHKFEWNGQSTSLNSPSNIDLLKIDSLDGYIIGDLNNDGIADICYLSTGLYCTLNDGGAQFSDAYKWTNAFDGDEWEEIDSQSSLALVDINNDTFLDVCAFNKNGFFCAENNQNGRFVNAHYWHDKFTIEDAVRLIDLDQDRLIDLCKINVNKIECVYNNGNGFGSTFTLLNSGWPLEVEINKNITTETLRDLDMENWGALPPPQFIDINNDGYVDICGFKLDSNFHCALGYAPTISSRSKYAWYQSAVWASGIPVPVNLLDNPSIFNLLPKLQESTEVSSRLLRTFKLKDINNDSLADICYRNGKSYQCMINDGTKFLDATQWFFLSGDEWQITDSVAFIESSIQLNDRNGDGLADLCYIGNDKLFCVYGNGSKFKASYGNDVYPLVTLRTDIQDKEEKSHFYSNGVRKVFGLKTRIRALFTYSAYGPFKQVQDLNGDATPDDCYRSFEGISCLLYEYKPLALLSSITSGLGYKTTFDYGFMSDPEVFKPSVNIELPLYSAKPNLNVVTAISRDNGIEGLDITQYQYEGYLAHKELGALGFGKIIKTVKSTNSKTTINYGYDDNLNIFVTSSSVKVNDILINNTGYKYENVKITLTKQVINQLKSKESNSYDLNGSLVKSSTTTYNDYDELHYPRSVATTSMDSLGNTFLERTDTTFVHNKTTWILGKPKRITVTKESPSDIGTRITEFDYYPSGALKQQTIEPGHDLELTTSFTYDSYGSRITENEIGKKVNRSSTTDYDAAGRVYRHTNSLGHSATTLYDPLCGLPSTITDANGLITSISYDGFCRKKEEVNPDATKTNYYFMWSDGADAGINRHGLILGDRSIYQLTSQSSTGSWKTIYYDNRGREVRSKQLGFNNKVVIKDTAYDQQGRVAGETIPYYEGAFAGDASYWSLTQYDSLGRLIKVSQPTEDMDHINTVVTYDKTKVSTLGQDGHLKEETKDGLGRIVEVVENSQSIVRYNYDVFGNLVNTDVNGQITTITYDLLGNKTSMVDPSMGTWFYGYDAKGRILWQLDAKKQRTDYSYDVLGRKKTEVSPGVSNSWAYDSLFLGLLTSESSFFSNKSYKYDSLGRVTSSTVTINEQSYTTSYDYNEDGRLSRVTYPSGLNLEKDYDLNGLLKRASLPNSDIWNKDYSKIEQALKETAASILELEIQASSYEESAMYYLEKSELLRQNAYLLLKEYKNLSEEANQLQQSAEALYESSRQYANLANNYRSKAKHYWGLFGARAFKYDKTENGSAYYKIDECVENNHKGCKSRDFFKVAIPEWMVESRVCTSTSKLAFLSEMFETCTTGPEKSVNLSDVYNKWAQHYEVIADGLNQQAQEKSNDASEFQVRAENANDKAKELLAQAESYADLAREQTDLLSSNMDELDSLVTTQQELVTMLDERLSDDTSTPIWLATNRDSFGQITSELFGNGFVTQREMDRAGGTVKRITTKFGDTLFRDINYVYDIRNNVLHKTSNVRLQKESYTYDDFDRLEYWLFEDGFDIKPNVREYSYDIYGNLTYKTGVGDLDVASSGRINSDATGLYHYDANGNMLSGRGRSFEWNSFNKVAKLSERGQQVKFQYGTNQERIKRSIGNKTTYYVSPDYEVDIEKNEHGQTITTMRHRIFADGQVVAEHIKTKVNDEKQVDKTAYFHRDALNTADLITDNMSKVQLERTYTPFGETFSLVKSQPTPTLVHENLRGYTGHENVGIGTLINMNARLYDPVIGRFISADSIIPSPYYSQSYNRYAYVYNNPLKYTDPSGHSAILIFALGAAIFTGAMTFEDPSIQTIGMVIGTVMMGVAGMQAGGWASAEAAAISGARVGFTTSFISSGGDLGDGVKGAILGGASAATAWGIGHGFGGNLPVEGKALAHGVTQGGFSELRGGSFREGFIGGAVAKLGGGVAHANISESMQPIGMLAVAGIAGLATGGNSDAYLSAAVSAITVYLYNALGTRYAAEAQRTKGFQTITNSQDEFSAYTKTPAFKSLVAGFLANRADNVATACLCMGALPCSGIATGVSISLSTTSVYYDYQNHQNINAAAVAGIGTDAMFKHVGDVAGHLGGGKLGIVIDSTANTVDYLFDEAADR